MLHIHQQDLLTAKTVQAPFYQETGETLETTVVYMHLVMLVEIDILLKQVMHEMLLIHILIVLRVKLIVHGNFNM